jgi:hypothetical protein
MGQSIGQLVSGVIETGEQTLLQGIAKTGFLLRF